MDEPAGPRGPSAGTLPGEAVVAKLEEAQRLGFLGPQSVRDQAARSTAFIHAAACSPTHAVDLGTGGGLPALVLACAWPGSSWHLVESNQRRARWLSGAVRALDLEGRCVVICDRAELLARGPLRSQADTVTARAFAPPSPTAECGAAFLALGGQLLVADPPGGVAGRWSPAGLTKLGLRLSSSRPYPTPVGATSISRLVALALCPAPYPRRDGVPFKRPLF